MNIRSETPTDYLAIAQIYKLAFGREEEGHLIEKIRSSQYYIPELTLIAEVNSSVIAHVMFSYINLVGKETFQVLGLAPVAVHPDFQNQGIGSALINAALDKANQLGESLIIVLGNPHFYSRFGFKPSVDFEIESPFPVPEDAFMVKPLTNYHASYKGKVIYPAAFQNV
ncbi:MAG: N-acetyltransferase [Rivularia sp. (in: Bacteria)]|nr:N-acetyltransferase [Rivularia sp. MS3]